MDAIFFDKKEEVPKAPPPSSPKCPLEYKSSYFSSMQEVGDIQV